LFNQISSKYKTWQGRGRLASLAADVAEGAQPAGAPVVFFNASARLGHLSQNAAFALLAGWGLRLDGLRIAHFVCNAGMSRCVLGINPDDAHQAPPCAACMAQSQRIFAGGEVHWFEYQAQAELQALTTNKSIAELQRVEFGGLKLGELVLPGLRWALRRQDLVDDEDTRLLYREAILSAHNVAREFDAYLEQIQPQAVVLFNGIMYPEAAASQVALRRGLRVITHEVGLQPLSAFFTDGEATAYPMHIPADFQLDAAQNAQLDAYLSNRFQGKFSMAGIQFWREMQQLDSALLAKMAQFQRVVPVFTNVIFDTSQVHANKLYADMFAWLQDVLALVRQNPQTLFVIRAHPDEMRPGTRKSSRQSVAAWVGANGVDKLPNVVFIDSNQYLSSYALIDKAHFVMVYNSSIGLEASILGKAVLSGGAARYTQYPTVYLPNSAAEYKKVAQQFISAERVEQRAAFVKEARRVLYFQLFRTSLPFGDYLEPHGRMGYVRLKDFDAAALRPENSAAIRAVRDGLMDGKPFLV
jgi:hypothetical protein